VGGHILCLMKIGNLAAYKARRDCLGQGQRRIGYFNFLEKIGVRRRIGGPRNFDVNIIENIYAVDFWLEKLNSDVEVDCCRHFILARFSPRFSPRWVNPVQYLPRLFSIIPSKSKFNIFIKEIINNMFKLELASNELFELDCPISIWLEYSCIWFFIHCKQLLDFLRIFEIGIAKSNFHCILKLAPMSLKNHDHSYLWLINKESILINYLCIERQFWFRLFAYFQRRSMQPHYADPIRNWNQFCIYE